MKSRVTKTLQIMMCIALAASAILFGSSEPASAQLQLVEYCSDNASDSDGDGWGWEGDRSCLVEGSQAARTREKIISYRIPCSDNIVEAAYDQWGWNNGKSCLLARGVVPLERTSTTRTTSADGATTTSLASTTSTTTNQTSDGVSTTIATLENEASPGIGSAVISTTTALTEDAVEDDADNNEDDEVQDAEPEDTTLRASAASRSQYKATMSPVRSNGSSAVPNNGPHCNGPSNISDLPGLQFGDYRMINNAWQGDKSTADWSQCITFKNGKARVDYDWGFEHQVDGALWDVKAYPEIIYGVMSEGLVYTQPSKTGLPVKVSEMPNWTIDYKYNSAESKKRYKTYNGRTVYGDRNIAIETFLHTDCNIVRNHYGTNSAFEIMVWLDKGPERLPSGSSGYVTTETIDGVEYDIWLKETDDHYVGFVAKEPQTQGTLDWNKFIDWSRNNAHQAKEKYGAKRNTVKIQDDWCMANILFGAEIWWGAGHFEVEKFDITRSK